MINHFGMLRASKFTYSAVVRQLQLHMRILHMSYQCASIFETFRADQAHGIVSVWKVYLEWPACITSVDLENTSKPFTGHTQPTYAALMIFQVVRRDEILQTVPTLIVSRERTFVLSVSSQVLHELNIIVVSYSANKAL